MPMPCRETYHNEWIFIEYIGEVDTTDVPAQNLQQAEAIILE